MRAAPALACVALLVACSSTPEHPVPAGPAFESDAVRFVAPTGWELLEPNPASPEVDQVVVYLANQPLKEECREIGTEMSCGLPMLGGLRAGGMVVVWDARPCAAQSCDLPSESLIAIGNRQGVRVANDQVCEGTGSTEGSSYYVTVTPQRVDVLITCARDPSEATRLAFLGFLDAIQWRIP